MYSLQLGVSAVDMTSLMYNGVLKGAFCKSAFLKDMSLLNNHDGVAKVNPQTLLSSGLTWFSPQARPLHLSISGG